MKLDKIMALVFVIVVLIVGGGYTIWTTVGAQKAQSSSLVHAQRVQAGQMAGWGPYPGQVPLFYCPQHQRTWPQAWVHPYYRCPICGSFLSRVQ